MTTPNSRKAYQVSTALVRSSVQQQYSGSKDKARSGFSIKSTEQNIHKTFHR